MERTLILGGGTGGIVSATVLKKTMGSSMEVTVIDRLENHYYTPSFPMLMIGARRESEIVRPLACLREKEIGFIHEEVKGIDPDHQQVITNKQILAYDYLILALGIEYHPETVPGFQEFAFNAYQFEDIISIKDRLSHFEAGEIVFFISSVPYKCPPAPYEMMFLLDQFFRQRGIRNKVKLTLVTPDFSPEPLAKPRVGQSVRNMLHEKNIDLITQAKILAVEKDGLVLDHGTRIPARLLLGVAPHWTPKVLRNTDLVDSSGYMEVDPHTLETKYPNIYGIGDAAAIRLPVIDAYAPKAGIFAHYQGEVVARNIALLAQGLNPKFRYTGKGA
ncbi:NAD(P)/FAD-dependent oxidoreductase [Dehalobacterium formicoaceticum]|uniref:FAD-dependent oxidoreductase n=1 Tax=Dehalobacterium formicoaceticum TaxID=51515 RepID=A0ABT1Y1T0_9FIRM|nr:FAD-dependent oxidoreductase [Dehalobacterium formicoaceticum]MCR6544821.1 FAD-dependent oxidoreductase [Dehalobacterium formicoaceticum]